MKNTNANNPSITKQKQQRGVALVNSEYSLLECFVDRLVPEGKKQNKNVPSKEMKKKTKTATRQKEDREIGEEIYKREVNGEIKIDKKNDLFTCGTGCEVLRGHK